MNVITEEKLKKHYRDNYKYDVTRQFREGNFFEQYWIKNRIEKIKKYITPSEKNILDLGCGTGEITKSIAKAFPDSDVVGIDISPWTIRKAKSYHLNAKNVEFLVGDAFNLKFRKNTFDIVISTEVIEHLLSPELIFDEVSRVLKKNGLFIICVPFKYHPIWQIESIRNLFSIDYKKESKEGGKHYEPFHRSYVLKDLLNVSDKFEYFSHCYAGLFTALIVVLKKSIS